MSCIRITKNELVIIINRIRDPATCEQERTKYIKLYSRTVPGSAALSLLELADPDQSDTDIAELALSIR